jgi:hypothetical protein
MQLNPAPGGLRTALAAATSCLLGGSAAALEATSAWEVDARLLYYGERDRVSLVEGAAQVTWDRGDDRRLGATIIFDALTGSSPNGAIPTTRAQTFTSPSGRGTYVTPANEVPLDSSFHDRRIAVGLTGAQPLGETLRLSWGLRGSSEFDYTSLGAEAGLERDFNLRNTTLSLGLAYNLDTSKPVGGVPLAGAFIPAYPARKLVDGTSDGKSVLDIQLGLTQVLTVRSLVRTNLVVGLENGYLNDPYKLVSVVDPVTGELDANPDRRYRAEARPDSRLRWAWYTAWQQGLREADVVRLSYRLYSDDWGMVSNTIDAFYRWQFTGRQFLEPHLRGYLQSAADFYRTSLPSNQWPAEVSADYRLADLWTSTVGLTWGIDLGPRSELRLGAEWYHQNADPSEVIGVQSRQTLIEAVDATMVRLGYALQW